MMQKQPLYVKTILLLCLFFIQPLNAGMPQKSIRPPSYQGRFYPADRSELVRTIQDWVRQADPEVLAAQKNGKVKALIMPHAGYIYSGLTAGHGAAMVQGESYAKVIIMGPDHRVGFSGCSVSRAAAWQTPLGKTPLHAHAQHLLGIKKLFHTDMNSERLEHSLEVVLPFIQACLGHFTLVPVVVGQCDIPKTARAINEILDPDTLLVVSSDLSHFLPYDEAVRKDKATINMILNGDSNAFHKSPNAACGKIPVLMLMEIAQKRKWQPRLIHYTNSGDTAGDRSRVVGYCAIAYLKDEGDRFSQAQGKILVNCARQALAEKLGMPTAMKGGDAGTRGIEDDDLLSQHRAVFVTLYLNGRLRGCIGSLNAVEPVMDNVRRHALNAAFRDPRFPALRKEEFQQVTIEVSILTPPKVLEYTDAEDLISKLQPGRDGLIIQKGHYRATYLPQVWEQLPDPEAFLSSLCRKAGMPVNEWKKGDLDIRTYQVQYFEEVH